MEAFKLSVSAPGAAAGRRYLDPASLGVETTDGIDFGVRREGKRCTDQPQGLFFHCLPFLPQAYRFSYVPGCALEVAG